MQIKNLTCNLSKVDIQVKPGGNWRSEDRVQALFAAMGQILGHGGLKTDLLQKPSKPEHRNCNSCM